MPARKSRNPIALRCRRVMGASGVSSVSAAAARNAQAVPTSP
jgi:hypothetical protein